jgi:hypothetical protein
MGSPLQVPQIAIATAFSPAAITPQEGAIVY